MTGERLSNWVTVAVRGMGALGGASVIVLAVLTSIDAVLRYLFNNPLIWAYDVSTYFMGACVFFGIPYTELHDGHVNVNVFFSGLSKKAQLIGNAILRGVMLVVCIVMTWSGFIRTVSSIRDNAATIGVVRIPRYPLEIAFFISMLLLTVFLAFRIYGYLEEAKATK